VKTLEDEEKKHEERGKQIAAAIESTKTSEQQRLRCWAKNM